MPPNSNPKRAADAVLGIEERFVVAHFGGERDVRNDGLDQLEGEPRLVALVVAHQHAHVALDVRRTPGAHGGIDAHLVDHARVGLLIRARRQFHAVQHGIVLETDGAEQTHLAAVEKVIRQEVGLAQDPALLILAEVDVLEAGESTGLERSNAVDQTEIELAFLQAGRIQELALGLHGMRAIGAEGREELAVGRGRDAAVIIAALAERRTDIDAHIGEPLLLARASSSTFLAAAIGDVRLSLGDNSLRLRFGERLGLARHLVFERVLLVAQVRHFRLEAIVLALQILQRGQDVIQLVQALEDLGAALFLLFRQVLDGRQRRKHIADAARADELARAIGHGPAPRGDS